MPHDQFRVLFVCTGNICRSPIAEGLVRRAAATSAHPEAGLLVAASSGVHGFDSAPMDPCAAAELRRLGGDPSPFRSRRLSGDMIEAADLVLTAQRGHRVAVLSLEPRALKRCFTVLEFARLARNVDDGALAADGLVARARSLRTAVGAMRGRLAPVTQTEDELSDPYGGPEEDYRACAEHLSAALDWVPRLLGDPPRLHGRSHPDAEATY